MNWWEALLINGAAGVISQFVKNPTAAAAFRGVLQHIYDDLGQVLNSLPPVPPTK